MTNIVTYYRISHTISLSGYEHINLPGKQTHFVKLPPDFALLPIALLLLRRFPHRNGRAPLAKK